MIGVNINTGYQSVFSTTGNPDHKRKAIRMAPKIVFNQDKIVKDNNESFLISNQEGVVSLILGKGPQHTMIDTEDYEKVSQYNWGLTTYGVSKIYQYVQSTKKNKFMKLHRFIMGLFQYTGLVVDHKNGNTLDNRKSNLRICTTAENIRNKAKGRYGASKYKGVCFIKARGKWMAKIKVLDKQYYLGMFDTQTEAALAYNEGAMKHHGDFARLNII